MAPKSTANSTALEPFSAPVRRWFEASFEAPTPAQDKGWPAIASGDNTLICAPTGSGKTLTAFLWGIDALSRRAAPDPDAATEDPEALGQGIRLVYVSPLKALSYDVDRNLRAPLKGIGAPIKVGLRTGDTPQKDRQAMLRKPPDILITTPESLYLMLTSRAQEILTNVDAVIVDEIHAVAQTKRGAHLALTLERLDHLVRTHEDGRGPDATVQRIGLSATQRPLERVANFLVGPKRKCTVVNAGIRKKLDLEIVVPVEDMTDPDASRPATRVEGRVEPEFPDRHLRRGAHAELDLARDVPEAARARAGAHLDDPLRQQPTRERSAWPSGSTSLQTSSWSRSCRQRNRPATPTTRPPRGRSRSRERTTARSRTRNAW